MNTLMAYWAVTKQGPFADDADNGFLVCFAVAIILFAIAGFVLTVYNLWQKHRSKRSR